MINVMSVVLNLVLAVISAHNCSNYANNELWTNGFQKHLYPNINSGELISRLAKMSYDLGYTRFFRYKYSPSQNHTFVASYSRDKLTILGLYMTIILCYLMAPTESY